MVEALSQRSECRQGTLEGSNALVAERRCPAQLAATMVDQAVSLEDGARAPLFGPSRSSPWRH